MLIGAMLVMLGACNSTRDLPEDALVLERNVIECDNPEVKVSSLQGYIRQRPATKLFSVIKKPGQSEVLYDSVCALRSAADIQNAVQNLGFLNASVTVSGEGKDKRITNRYVINTGEQYYISSFKTDIRDEKISQILTDHKELLARMRPGREFSVYAINDVRKQITSLLQDQGFYHFNKDFIEFAVDTLSSRPDADVVLTIFPYRATTKSPFTSHAQYKVRSVNYLSSLDELKLRPSVLDANTSIREGELYSASALQKTYNNYAHLNAVRYTNINFVEDDSLNLLDCNILLSTHKPQTVSFQPEGTNTAGDLGAAASLIYENRNLFHGSELLTLKGRAAYEAITGLEGYSEQNYQEYSVESKLSFPRFLVPLKTKGKHFFDTMSASLSELVISYNLQNRPEFHRRLFSASWRYKWADLSGRRNYRLDVLDLNYVYMPWISETFKRDYLENDDNRNAILRYNYADLFIMKLGFGFTFNDRSFSLRTNIETAGNILHGLATLTKFRKNDEGQNTLFNIAYAQYVKGDVDFTRLMDIDENNQLALHVALGVAWPYGNSRILPFEKRYFSGGANSLRGWSVRSIGPGHFKGKDGRIDFINQTGDMKIDLSAELRTRLFWKFSGAVFVDAGNIWTLRDYADQEGGCFRIDSFWKEMAVSYGMGLRLNFDYFILRLDAGMKAVNPVYDSVREHFPILSPNISRDMALHFAVGLPF